MKQFGESEGHRLDAEPKHSSSSFSSTCYSYYYADMTAHNFTFTQLHAACIFHNAVLPL